jgi:eukaryotic-like serine/threonine-protein kinase
LSRFVTVLGITEWLIAGMVYPIALNVLTKGLLETKWYFHFVGSLLICGLVAAAYPFFMTATLTIKSFLPSLLQSDRLRAADVAQLHRLSEQSTWSLYLAGGVPAVGMMILLMTQQQTTTENSSFALTALSIVGAVGFALILSLSKSLQSDIEALLEAARLVGQDED